MQSMVVTRLIDVSISCSIPRSSWALFSEDLITCRTAWAKFLLSGGYFLASFLLQLTSYNAASKLTAPIIGYKGVFSEVAHIRGILQREGKEKRHLNMKAQKICSCSTIAGFNIWAINQCSTNAI